jgi:hypothetical protein
MFISIKAIFLMIIIFYFTSCKKSFEPFQEPFDQHIVGDWISSYEKDPFPFPAITGIQIQDNGDAYPLSIEIETGKLKKSSNNPSYKYYSANNGVFVYESLQSGLALSSKYKRYYKIKDDTLFLSVNYEESYSISEPKYSSFRIRSEVGTQISPPVSATFETMLDSTNLFNININPYPSAYSYFNGNILNIIAELNYCAILNFEITNFAGIGTYDLASSYASYSQGCGCAIQFTDTYIDSSSIFTIEITSFDSTRIIGSFDLNFEQLHFQDGNFNIPVY